MPDSQVTPGPCQQIPLRRRRLCRWATRFVCLFTAVGLAVGAYQWWTRPRPTRPTEIFCGVNYTCIELNEPECRGLVHLVKVDLSAPGIQLYLTPLDPEAVARGWQYRLDTAPAVLDREQLAVVVNAAFFASESGLWQSSGDFARGVQTIVAEGQLSHVDPYSYLLCFES